jgi:hypothetical protein
MKKIIAEGGHVFKDQTGAELTQRINRADVEPTVKWLEQLTGLSLLDNMLGTTGRKETSGDLDLAVDASKIEKDTLVQVLLKKGVAKTDIRKSGDNVHYKAPIAGNPQNGFVQTDFMFGEPSWQHFSMQGGNEGSDYKGMHRHLLLASIAKALGYKWSYKNGLVNRDDNTPLEGGKTPAGVSKILGIPANKLNNVEDIIDSIKGRADYQQLVADAREGFARDNLKLPESAGDHAPIGTAAWYRNFL